MTLLPVSLRLAVALLFIALASSACTVAEAPADGEDAASKATVPTQPPAAKTTENMPALATVPIHAGTAAADMPDDRSNPDQLATAPSDDSTDTKPFAFSPESAPRPINHCGFEGLEIPIDTKVFAAGAYGGENLAFQIDDSGHQATRMDVAVNHSQAPVLLILGSYEPTVWSIGWSQGTRIVAVLVSGYHRQVLTGLPSDIPVLISTHDNEGACGGFYVDPKKADRLNPISRRVFGRPVDMLYPVHKGRVVIGSPLSPAARLVTDKAAKPVESFRLPNSQLAGEQGLEYAVRNSLLRPATPADVAAWNAAWSKSQAVRREQADVPPIAGGAPVDHISMPHNGYVVLKAFRFPSGLYGAHSATFFVPKGVPRPTGNRGHSTVYDFNSIACTGAMCGHD